MTTVSNFRMTRDQLQVSSLSLAQDAQIFELERNFLCELKQVIAGEGY